jgi:hypothetical protein
MHISSQLHKIIPVNHNFPLVLALYAVIPIPQVQLVFRILDLQTALLFKI